MADGRTIDVAGIDALIGLLRDDGYTVIGPVLRDGVVDYRPITSVAELPRGVTDDQAAGSYRLRQDPRDLRFGFTKGAASWKAYLFPPRLALWSAERPAGRPDGAWTVAPEPEPGTPYAFLGVRACDLAAIAIQDRVLMGGAHADPSYRRRRQDALVIAVTCSQAASTCFCLSMGTGPEPAEGCDLAVTELGGGDGARFLVEARTERGSEVLAAIPSSPALENDLEAAGRMAGAAVTRMGDPMPAGAAAILAESLDHPRWQDVASRCLACGNCTLVCPTCFCVAVEDRTSLDGSVVERSRRWDTCFASAHSYIHGGPVRATTRARYRQWLTHKLWTWDEQFGTAGCTGCGRCVTWCPAAIDIREEVVALAPVAPKGVEP